MRNILISSVGKRVEMIKLIQAIIPKLGIDAKVYTCDVDPDNSPACKMSDGSFAVPRLTSEDYMQVLQSICLGNNVKIIIPTTERELPILSANKNIFANLGICILTPDYDFVMKCMDTHRFGDYLNCLGIKNNIPQQMDNYETLVDTALATADFAECIVRKYLAE